MAYKIKAPKKLIEVALPLDAINAASAREKSVKVGKPTNMHLWWARRPLAAARAVIFSQLVNDPSWKWEMEHPSEIPPGHLKASWAASRKRLFKIIEDLVLWENTTNEAVLERARAEIRKSWQEVCKLNKDHPQASELFNPDDMPGLHDPFAGGGAIPLEAQRLGLKAFASDLNPVAVLINKAMIEIPPKFAGMPPVNPEARSGIGSASGTWKGTTGLAEDVRYYGEWVRKEAEKRIGHLYPPVEVTEEMAETRSDLKPYVGQKLKVIAWIWARTVKSPNPAFSNVDVPLVSSFVLSSKKGKEVYVQPIIEGDRYRFTVRTGKAPDDAKAGTTAGKRKGFLCLVSDAPIPYNYIYEQGQNGSLSERLMSIVAEGDRGRIYLSPDIMPESITSEVPATWKPETKLHGKCRVNVSNYGFDTFADLFTARQLSGLNALKDVIQELEEVICNDGGSSEYADAILLYMTFALSRTADWGNSLGRWESKAQVPQQLFGKQAIGMVWDYCETNFFSTSTGSYIASIKNIVSSFGKIDPPKGASGLVNQEDATIQTTSSEKVISTDPPYYDNIAYADLSDFFYVWIRRVLRHKFPSLMGTISAPKDEELVATAYRHGSKEQAENFFLNGMTKAIRNISELGSKTSPITIYYAFKQSETKAGSGTFSAGWLTFLEAIYRSGLYLTGTWPLRTENASRMVAQGANALASSIVLVCRKRPDDAPTTSRRAFIRELNSVLPDALDEMTKGSGDEQSPVAPVDLSQAIIGPGMAVFSKYSSVLEADGSAMSVKTALQLINRFLAEDDFDADTSFCLHWFEQYSWKDGIFGEADVLARAKGTSVDGVNAAGVIASGSGQVRLLKWADYPTDWDAAKDKRLPVWEALHQLIRVLKQGGESEGGIVLAAVADKAEAIRQLAYRLYTLCERKGWAEDARAYNELITSWTALESAAANAPKQRELFD